MLAQDGRLGTVVKSIAPLSTDLVAHPLYSSITELQDIRTFMESHVFAVWDFMCLLKALQQRLTCVESIWVPDGDAETRRMINEIVLCEESDEAGAGHGSMSHFEIYMLAMQECGADIEPIQAFLDEIKATGRWPVDLNAHRVPAPAQRFLEHTKSVLKRDKLHEIAASFTFGRENVIPDMFTSIVGEIDDQTGRLGTLVYYLKRHIEVDGDEHGPLACRMIERLCGDDPQKWTETEETARTALQARIVLWDGIERSIRASKASLREAA